MRYPLAGGEKLARAVREYAARCRSERRAKAQEKRRKRKTGGVKKIDRAPSTLTPATVRDVWAMERAFREAVAE